MFKCNDDCCKIYTTKYDNINDHSIHRVKMQKAGVLCFDTEQNKILIIQSRGKYWSVPKGGCMAGETIEETAVRELYEESGLIIDKSVLNKHLTISNRTYFYLEMKEQPIVIPKFDGNDSHSFTWIKIGCLQKLIDANHMLINSDCKQLIEHFIIKRGK